MDTTVHLIHGQQLIGGWLAQIRDGSKPATPEQVYTAVRSLLRLADDDVVLHSLSRLLVAERDGGADDGFWNIPLDVVRLADLISHDGNLHWLSAGIDIWVDVKVDFAE